MDDNTIICRCEEVTLGEIKEAINAGLLAPGDIRKYTRAGMGTCQGRTCQRLIMQILKKQLRQDIIAEDTVHTRIPIQPVRMDSAAQWIEGGGPQWDCHSE